MRGKIFFTHSTRTLSARRASREERRGEDSFRTAASAAQAIHNVKFDVSTGTRRTLPGLPNGANLADDFDAHFDNLATAATHGNEVVQDALSQITATASS